MLAADPAWACVLYQSVCTKCELAKVSGMVTSHAMRFPRTMSHYPVFCYTLVVNPVQLDKFLSFVPASNESCCCSKNLQPAAAINRYQKNLIIKNF